MVNLVYQTAKVATELDIEDRDFKEFSEMFKMVDMQFSDDLVAIWKSARKGMHDGLGNEGVMVMDLKGKMMNVPDMPAVLLENVKIPRLAIGYNVEDRNELADSWKEIDVKIKQIIAKLETLTKEKINYEKAELTKKEGIDFWSYQLGITSYESNLALGINDEMMFLNTSPAMVEGLVSGFDVDGQLGGMEFKMRMAPMREYARGWIELMDKHGNELSPTFGREEFNETKVLMDEMIRMSEEIDSLDFSMKKKDGEVRSYFHLNKRN